MTDPDFPDHASSQSDPVASNSALGWWLSGIMTLAYGGFLVAGAFANQALARPAIGSIPWSFVLGLGLLASAVAITGFYVLVTNAREGRGR